VPELTLSAPARSTSRIPRRRGCRPTVSGTNAARGPLHDVEMHAPGRRGDVRNTSFAPPRGRNARRAPRSPSTRSRKSP
jgi:hypothetical protein